MTATLSSLEKLRSNAAWAKLPLFNRSKWKPVRFGDVVENLNETCDPKEVGLDRYIAMEHMQPGSLHIRTWGNVADGTTFNRCCRPGQLLFGKRRAYQRKVAVAEFDAVVSGDIYVLAPKTDRLLAELLPFICLSERFFQHAVGTSAGSLSPRTNWTSLASYEFALPPLDQQRRIADVLWAADRTTETYEARLASLSMLKQAAMEELTRYAVPPNSGRAKSNEYPTRPLKDVAVKFQYGLSCALGGSGAYPILRMMNYDEELVAATDLKFADMLEVIAKEFEVQKGDILFNRTNSADLVGKVGISRLEGKYLFASYLVRIQTDTSVRLPDFLNYYLNSRHGQSAVRAFASPGVSQSNISAGNLKKVAVPIAPIHLQKAAVAKLDQIASVYRQARMQVETQRGMLRAFINAVM